MIKTEGFEALVDRLIALDDTAKASKVMRAAARKSMKLCQAYAKATVPVVTGALRDSIRIGVKKGRTGNIVMSAGLLMSRRVMVDELESDDYDLITTKTVEAGWRWHWTEFGVGKRPAKPFLRPAFDQTKTNIIRVFGEELGKGIEKAFKAKKAEV